MSLSTLLSLLAAAYCVTARLFPRPGYINPWEIEYNLYYGQGSKVDISKMFLLPPIEKIQQTQEGEGADYEEEAGELTVMRRPGPAGPGVVRIANPALLDLEQSYQTTREKLMFHDFDENLGMEKDFLDDFPNQNDMIEKIQNVSHIIKDYRRRMLSRRDASGYVSCWGRCYSGWRDYSDWDWYTWEKENQKRVMVNDLILAFLIHMRYKLKEAMVIRYLVKNDKRYMIGYNFNRIRRLMYDMRKMFTSQVLLEADYYQKSFLTQSFVHRHFIHLETDCRDTINNIIHIHWNQIEPVTYEPTPKKKRSTKPPKSPKTTTTKFVPGNG